MSLSSWTKALQSTAPLASWGMPLCIVAAASELWRTEEEEWLVGATKVWCNELLDCKALNVVLVRKKKRKRTAKAKQGQPELLVVQRFLGDSG